MEPSGHANKRRKCSCCCCFSHCSMKGLKLSVAKFEETIQRDSEPFFLCQSSDIWSSRAFESCTATWHNSWRNRRCQNSISGRQVGLRFYVIFTLNWENPASLRLGISRWDCIFSYSSSRRPLKVQHCSSPHSSVSNVFPALLLQLTKSCVEAGRKKKKKTHINFFFPPRAEMSLRSVEKTGRFRYRCVRETRVRLMERERELIRPLKDASDRREADRTSSSSFINHTGGPRGEGLHNALI